MFGLPPIDASTALIVTQDGVTTGAIYALVALSLVLVFSVTRVIFVTQGVLVTFGALTVASLEQGRLPGTVWVLALLGATSLLVELIDAVRRRSIHHLAAKLAFYGVLPAAVTALTFWLAPTRPPQWLNILLAMIIVTPMGAMIYRVAFQRIADASLLTLAFVAVAALFVLEGAALLFFGAEGVRTLPFSDASIAWGPVTFSGQSLWIYGAAIALMLILWVVFNKTLLGKALRGTAINRVGGRLVGIPVELTGTAAFTIAAFLGSFSGVLIAPTSTIYFDTGFLIVLKGMVGAVVGGMSAYGLATAGSVAVGVVKSFALYFTSAYADAVVFLLLIPILLSQSLLLYRGGEEEDPE